MKKKHILILIFLIAPFIAMAQFKVDLSLNAGINKIKMETPGPGYDQSGFSFRGGVDAIYMFNSTIGIGSGLYYSYYESKWELPDIDRSSNAISIPLNMLYHFKSIPIEVLFGAIANFNLNKELGLSPSHVSEYKPLYMNIELGGLYYISKKIKLGIIADVRLTPYFEVTSLYPSPQNPSPLNKHFLQSLSLKLNCTLFGKQ